MAPARKHPARRNRVMVKEITLENIESTDWSDAGSGYPQKGKAYAPINMPGYRLVLSDRTGYYEHHVDSYLRVIGSHGDRNIK